jgi:hypothetical protein
VNRLTSLATAAAVGLVVSVAPAVALAADPWGPGITGTSAYVGGATIDWMAENVPSAVRLGGDTPPLGAIKGVAAGDGKFLAVGNDQSTHGGVGAEPASWITTDGGLTWTEHLQQAGFSGLVAQAGVFVSVGGRFLWSRDGVTWAAAGPTGIHYAPLTVGLGKFVAIANFGSRSEAWTSVDGASWHRSANESVLSNFCPEAIAGNNARVVAIGRTCGSMTLRAVFTTDGQTWRSGSVPTGMPVSLQLDGVTVQSHPSLAWTGGRFLAFSYYRSGSTNGTAVWSSTDGMTWHRTSFLASQSFRWPDEPKQVVQFGAGWIAAGFAANGAAVECWPAVWKSADLVHWSRMTVPEVPWRGTCEQPIAIAAAGDSVVIAGDSWASDYNSTAAWTGRLVTPPSRRSARRRRSG